MVGFLMMMILVALGVLLLAGGVERVGGRRAAVDGVELSSAQLDRIESALTSLEARVDDLQEQQRFLERLLAERPEPRAALDRGEEAGTEAGERKAEESILFETDPAPPSPAEGEEER